MHWDSTSLQTSAWRQWWQRWRRWWWQW